MGHGAGIFRELCGAQQGNVFNALDRWRSHVGGELGIPEHGEAFLQAQLEPVTTGDPVAGPVVEVLVGDDGLDALEGGVGRRVLAGQHAGGVENIQALVFHGPHVEVIHRHDHEDIQVVFAAVDVFIPAHGALEGVHGEIALLRVAGLHVHSQVNVTAGTGGEGVFFLYQVSGNQREQISRLGERVFPGDKVAAVFELALLYRVAVGQQYRVSAFIGFNPGAEPGHHIRAVRVESDATEALGLALGTEHSGGLVQTFQPGIVLRLDPGNHLQFELLRYRRHDQRIATVFEITGSQR